MKTFIELCLEGIEKPENIDNYIHSWHESTEENGELHEFLGMELPDYITFVKNHNYIYELVNCKIKEKISEGIKQDLASMDC